MAWNEVTVCVVTFGAIIPLMGFHGNEQWFYTVSSYINIQPTLVNEWSPIACWTLLVDYGTHRKDAFFNKTNIVYVIERLCHLHNDKKTMLARDS